jgi:hypothetical protein
MASDEGDYAAARPLLAECLAVAREFHYRTEAASALEILAIIALAEGQTVQAARLFAAADNLKDSVQGSGEDQDFRRQKAALQDRLGEAAFAALWAEGHALTLEQAVDYALVEIAASVAS